MSAPATSSAISFESAVERLNGSRIIRFPAAASRRLPSRGQVAVRGIVNGDRIETVVEPDGERGHWFKVPAQIARRLGAATRVAVELEVAEAWPEPEVPEDLKQALARAPKPIQAMWKDITPMARWEWVRWVNATRNPQTRQRRVEVTISKMLAGKRRPCCFDLSACTDPDLSRSGRLIRAPEPG